MTKEAITSALEKVKYPGFSRDIVSFGLVQGVAFENGVASVSIEVTNADPTVPTQMVMFLPMVPASFCTFG